MNDKLSPFLRAVAAHADLMLAKWESAAYWEGDLSRDLDRLSQMVSELRQQVRPGQ